MCAYIERDIDIQKDKHHFPLELDPALLFVTKKKRKINTISRWSLTQPSFLSKKKKER
jgi:hypothetical protein